LIQVFQFKTKLLLSGYFLQAHLAARLSFLKKNKGEPLRINKRTGIQIDDAKLKFKMPLETISGKEKVISDVEL